MEKRRLHTYSISAEMLKVNIDASLFFNIILYRRHLKKSQARTDTSHFRSGPK